MADLRVERTGRGILSAALTAALASALALVATPASAQTDPLPAGPAIAPFRDDEFTIGAATAPVTVVEYVSVTCTHCAAFLRDTWPQTQRELVDLGRVRFVIREMPTAPVAVSAAGFLMARCRGETAYWPTVERLLENQARTLVAKSVEEALRTEAEISGLSEADMRLCLSDPVAIDAVNARRQAGLAEGVDSTPFFVINGAPLRPGVRLGGKAYQGGELTYRQLTAAVAAAVKGQAVER